MRLVLVVGLVLVSSRVNVGGPGQNNVGATPATLASPSSPCVSDVVAPLQYLGNEAPLGTLVPLAIKEKIWNGNYVDMASLYVDNAVKILSASNNGAEVALVVEQGRVVLRPSSARVSRKLDSIEKWTSAFHVFIAVFAIRHPGRVVELLRYAETIRTAALQFPGLGWRSYDEQFRLRMEVNPARSWAAMDMELWVTVAAVGSVAPAVAATSVPSRSQAQKRICYAFNSPTGCRWFDCRYVHSCRRCAGGGHGESSCRVGGRPPTFGTAASARPWVDQPKAVYTRYTKTPGVPSGVRRAGPSAAVTPRPSGPSAANAPELRGKRYNFRSPNAN